MANASRIMYKLGRIFNFIYLGLGILLVVLSIILLVGGETDEQIATGSTGVVFGGYLLITAIIALILSAKALRSIGDGKVNRGPHIMMIVVGAIASEIFYLLGGIFGLVSEGQANH